MIMHSQGAALKDRFVTFFYDFLRSTGAKRLWRPARLWQAADQGREEIRPVAFQEEIRPGSWKKNEKEAKRSEFQARTPPDRCQEGAPLCLESLRWIAGEVSLVRHPRGTAFPATALFGQDLYEKVPTYTIVSEPDEPWLNVLPHM